MKSFDIQKPNKDFFSYNPSVIKEIILSFSDNESIITTSQLSRTNNIIYHALMKERLKKEISKLAKRFPEHGHSEVALISALHIRWLKYFIDNIKLCKNLNFKIYLHNDKSVYINLLHIAAFNGTLRCIKILLQNQVEYTVAPKGYYTSPFHYAAAGGHTDCLLFFLKQGAPVNLQTTVSCPLGWNWTALQIASSCGKVNCVELLISHGASVSLQDPDGYQAIHRACQNGHLDCLNTLITHGADVNSHNEDMITPLLLATDDRHSNCVDSLLKAGANPRHGCLLFQRFKLPLQIAIKNKDLTTARILLNFDATLVDARLSDEHKDLHAFANMTALHCAAEMGFFEGVKLLLDFDADIDIKTQKGLKASKLAKLKGHFNIVNYIREYKKNRVDRIIFHDDPEEISKLNI